ncbi:general secretion pathway protein GspB [Arsukibacterium sp.]|uniref:general secretion pathway protein GspB n=1 Tax=Arsukibacterium sp. TaxID=1977258 RepID=UPI001BD1F00B|nr:general secretion pathway protein GspB [Arsukibacterium sp.]
MDALKQQVEPVTATTVSQPANGWRNLALLLGFCLALLLGFALASWWQTTNAPQPVASDTIAEPAEPDVATRSTIVAALLSVPPETETALSAEPAVKSSRPRQEQFKAEPKVVSVTAPSSEPDSGEIAAQPAVSSQPEVEVSDELRQRFASAMAASEVDNRQSRSALRGNSAPAQDISELAPALQQQIPALRFEAHVYATQGAQRWIKVNGKSLQEGQWVTADIQLQEITPHFVLLKMDNELFSMPALTDYK